ncbi:Uu.00g138660.m01.CDS01 [Anthostomella pinea]|uniref:Uu.00g138660.m01.CDS01 n=1 Tax=Anthostomella pinea TaxID=933095 RepID=A0AAI8YLC5_9PEZI|nr:Uu.00g138660.m01.CDS01 [Anthostomella pinea]
MTYGSSSEEDEFPDVEVMIRKHKQKTQGKQRDGNKENALKAPKSTTVEKLERKGKDKQGGSSAPATAVKATPLRRRKLGQAGQTIGSSLLKPWNDSEDTSNAPGDGISKLKTSRGARSREGSAESSTVASTNDLLDRAPVKVRQTGSRTASSSIEHEDDIVVEERKKPRRLITRGERKAMDQSSSKELAKAQIHVSESEEEGAIDDSKYDLGFSEDGMSDFIISADEVGAEASDSESDIFLTPPKRRSRSPSETLRKPRRVLSPSKDPATTASKRTDPAISLEKPSKPASKEHSNDNVPRDKASTAPKPARTNKGDLEDAFRKLQIFNEDSDPDDMPVKGKNPILEPMTPRKTLTASPLKTPKIPLSPWKPEHKEFWDPEVNFAWIDKHSPPKKSSSPKKLDLTGGASTSDFKAELKRRYGNSPEKRDAKKAFDAIKEDLARSFLRELDERITEGRLERLTECTGGLRIVWSNTLNSTAGRAHWKCKTITTTSRQPTSSSSSSTSASSTTTTVKQHQAHIELATKVLTNTPDLLNTVAHEFCHLAVFILDGKPKSAHGPEFKAWGARCGAAFGRDRGIEVTTKHSYDIEYKYIWRCDECAAEVRRHSKSVNTSRQRCGGCRGVLVQVKPVPRGGGNTNTGTSADGKKGGGVAAADGVGGGKPASRKQSAWQEFMAWEMKEISAANKGMSFKDRMAVISARWNEQQIGGGKERAGAVEVIEIRDDGDRDKGVVKGQVGATYDLFS